MCVKAGEDGYGIGSIYIYIIIINLYYIKKNKDDDGVGGRNKVEAQKQNQVGSVMDGDAFERCELRSYLLTAFFFVASAGTHLL